MHRQPLKLLLLPGMDGTGELFGDFVKLLPDWIEPQVLSYPSDRKLSYDELSPILASAVPPHEDFVILAESFSTPLAVRFAATAPDTLQALVLCAGFVSPPRRGFLGRITAILAPMLFAIGLPEWVCRRFLVGGASPQSLVDNVRATVSKVSSQVLAHRLAAVLSCKQARELKDVSVPLLYISASEDRLVRSSSWDEVKKAKPDASVVAIDAPHLILQVKPRKAVDAFISFLQEVGVAQEQ